MKFETMLCCSVLLVFAATILADEGRDADDQQPDRRLLIEADQLQARLKDQTVRVVDVRSIAEYNEAHIPGAIHVDLDDWKRLAAAADGLHDAASWSKRLNPLGLTAETPVVVCGNNLSGSARIWWLLKYVGAKDVSLLNGGWEWWNKSGRPVEADAAEFRAVDFAIDFQSDRVEEFDAIKNSMDANAMQLIDTRSDGEFEAGRIPGSVHLEWKELIADDGRFKTEMQLKQLFQDRGIRPTEAAVCY